MCKTVKSRHQRNKFKDKSGGSGVELFRWLNTEIARLIDEDAAEALEEAIIAFFNRGLTAHTPNAFNPVADQVVLSNEVLSGNSRHIAEPALAGKFLDLMQKELGKTEYSELKRDIKDLGGIGSVKKTRDIGSDRCPQGRRHWSARQSPPAQGPKQGQAQRTAQRCHRPKAHSKGARSSW